MREGRGVRACLSLDVVDVGHDARMPHGRGWFGPQAADLCAGALRGTKLFMFSVVLTSYNHVPSCTL